MSTKMENLRRVVLSATVAALAVLGPASARADLASDKPAALLIYPKVIVDTEGVLTGAPNTDTFIQVTNVSGAIVGVRCFLVNATWTCSNNPLQACTPETEVERCGPGAACQPPPVCDATDFEMTLTKRQPVRWSLGQGTLGSSPGDQPDNLRVIPAASTDPFIGEVKCVEVDPTTFKPINEFPYQPPKNPTGDLVGTATIVSGKVETSGPPQLDAREYSALGFQPAGPNNGDDALVLGGANAEYAGCPNVVILDHLFDDASVTSGNGITGTVRSDLTVVPCTQDLSEVTEPASTVLQFLVFNEFEQRFSTSTRLGCFKEVPLSNIDTRPTRSDDYASVFNVNVQGTLSGQSRLRAVSSATSAKGVVALLEEFWECELNNPHCTTAANTHFSGSRSLSDTITMHPLQ